MDEEEITGALVATRQNKKKAADDAKLLANRIALLKLEEKKAWKKRLLCSTLGIQNFLKGYE